MKIFLIQVILPLVAILDLEIEQIYVKLFYSIMIWKRLAWGNLRFLSKKKRDLCLQIDEAYMTWNKLDTMVQGFWACYFQQEFRNIAFDYCILMQRFSNDIYPSIVLCWWHVYYWSQLFYNNELKKNLSKPFTVKKKSRATQHFILRWESHVIGRCISYRCFKINTLRVFLTFSY